jgi:nucleoporin NUP82
MGKSLTSHLTRQELIGRSQAQAVIGSAAFCNISLGYGILALTASQQLASSELDFRANEHTIAAIAPKTNDPSTQPSSDERSFLAKQPDISTLIDGTISYTKYTPPNIRGNKDLRGPVENITAAHLKLLGEVTVDIRKRTEAIRAASQKVENRLDLQVREYQRQIKLLKSARGEMKGLSGDDGSERVSAIASKQRELGERLDRVLSSAMASHKGPDVSESERKWFDELEKLHGKVGSLSTRFSQVSNPSPPPLIISDYQMSQQVEKAKSGPRSAPKPVEPLKSEEDIRPIKTQVEAESEEIRKMLRKMDRLSVRVEAAMIEGEESD